MKIFVLLTLFLTLVFVQNIQAQSNPYPNELKGYEFFGKGKLKGLILGFSKKEDVERIFDEDCEVKCDYDENWTVNFIYLGNMTKLLIEGASKKVYAPDKIYFGTLHSIKMRPKTNFSLKEITFSSEFNQGITSSSSYSLSTSCFSGNASASTNDDNNDWMNIHHFYKDKYGLSYTVFDEVFKDSPKNVEKREKGDLISVEYAISGELEKKMFLEKNCSDTIYKSICF